MKKATRILVLAASLTLLLALVSTANAGSDKCHKNDPGCSTTTTTTTVVPRPFDVGLSCADWFTGEADHPLTWDADENDTFLLYGEQALTSRDNTTCIDVSTTTAGSFTVEVTSVDPEPNTSSILVALKLGTLL